MHRRELTGWLVAVRLLGPSPSVLADGMLVVRQNDHLYRHSAVKESKRGRGIMTDS